MQTIFFKETGLEKGHQVVVTGGGGEWAWCGNRGVSFGENPEHVDSRRKSSQWQGRRQKWSQKEDN